MNNFKMYKMDFMGVLCCVCICGCKSFKG